MNFLDFLGQLKLPVGWKIANIHHAGEPCPNGYTYAADIIEFKAPSRNSIRTVERRLNKLDSPSWKWAYVQGGKVEDGNYLLEFFRGLTREG